MAPPTGRSVTCSERFNFVDPILKRWFRWLGSQIGKRPGYFLIFPVFFSLLALTGFQRLHTESRPEKLFALKSGRAQQALNLVGELFPLNDTAFDHTRRHDLNNLVRIQISAPDGGTLLTTDALAEVVQLDQLVRNTVIRTDVGGDWRYEDVCASWDGHCEKNEALRLANMAADLESGAVKLSYPIHLVDIWSDEPAIILPQALGSPVLDNSSTVIRAPAISLSYYTARGHVYYGVDVSRQWENEVLQRLLEVQPTLKHVHISFYLSQTLGEELDNNVYSVIPYMSVNYVLMGTFCVLACLMKDWVRGKPVVVLAGLLGAAMATGTAFGILMYCGVPFIGINIAAPFLMLGIGVDDTFVVLSAWWRTRLTDSVPRRMAEAYEEAAVSITITSLTDMFSFWVGVATPIPSVQIFCLYTGMSVVFTYLWHIFFFGACLALSGYAEQKNLHSVTFQPIPAPSEAAHRSRLYRLFCTGGRPSSEPWRESDNNEHGVMHFFKYTFARILNMPKVKALVMVLFATYLGGAVYGCLQVQEGLDKRRLARQDSYSHKFFVDQAKYFQDLPYRVQVILNGTLPYWEPEIQEQVETLMETFENSTYVSDRLYNDCWLREWVNLVENSRGILNFNVSTPEEWISSLKSVFLFNSDRRFKLDVVFDESGQEIVASRFLIQTHDVRGVTQDSEMMEELRRICDASPLKCEVFEPHFIFFDQYTYVRTITIQSTVVATIIMCIISLIFIPNPICSLWVALSIMSIEIGVIGYMSLWGVNLDSISMINLIMCIGFSVDFSAHISYAYMSAHGLSADRRVEESLYCLGLPILQGAVSTIIGVSTLILAPSYIFEVFFKTIFLVIFFGVMHGLILLPVMLSIFGPGSALCGRRPSRDEEQAEDSSTTPQPPAYLTPGPLVPNKPDVAPEIMAIAPAIASVTSDSQGSPPGSSTSTLTKSGQPTPFACGVTEAQKLSFALDLSGDDTSSVGSAPHIPRARLVRRRSRCASATKDTYSNAGYCSDSEGTSVSGAGGTDTGFSDAAEDKSGTE
ncbi:patched domain-containing protein 3-like [Amphibalanus amphitrite]|uniref:patched domain-containing protein 3-like n=1 Tax=Amphibalanus amphitrite TaxID=1232801 RepID=UPI001C91B69A|nr:patched domain-containing protein 3-like [Amphibalanus amphitrite]